MFQKTKRIHSLDALRAIMMLLGIVYHAGISYCVYDQGRTWPLKDPNTTNIIIDFIIGYIHIFRMPIFFVVAGFFGALLFYERSPKLMLQNRFKRVLLPFAVFVILMWPILGSSYLITYEAFTGDVAPQASEGFSIALLIPQSSFHLWFLQYLFMISVIAFGLAIVMKKLPSINRLIFKMMKMMLGNVFIKVGITSVLVFIVLILMNREWVDTTNYFTPNWKTLLFYSTFYFFGWVLFKTKERLDSFMKYDWPLLGVSLLLYGIILSLKGQLTLNVIMLLNALTVSLCLYSITGLFIRYFSKGSTAMRYISDASYWVYIIHMPFTLAMPGLLAFAPLSSFMKFFIITLVTSLIAFVTYNYWVRSTFIGKFLNGRKYPKREFKFS